MLTVCKNNMKRRQSSLRNFGNWRGAINMKLFAIFGREFRLYRNNSLLLACVCFVCTVFLWAATAPETFNSYSEALPVVFAKACASILIGLMLSINMVCKDYAMIRRELRMGISAKGLIFAKTFLNIILCAIMSVILTLPYLIGIISVLDQNTSYLYLAVFFTMFTSAQLGLFISSFSSIFSQNRLQKAALAIPFVMLFQILFSGFVFEQVRIDLSSVSISNYAIRTIGSGLRFDSETFIWDTPVGAFENSFPHALLNLGALTTFMIFAIIGSIIILNQIDKQGLDE